MKSRRYEELMTQAAELRSEAEDLRSEAQSLEWCREEGDEHPGALIDRSRNYENEADRLEGMASQFHSV